MSETPAAVLQTTMTRSEFIDTCKQFQQPEPQDCGPFIRYEFCVEATEKEFKRLMDWLDVHGIHGTFRAMREAADA